MQEFAFKDFDEFSASIREANCKMVAQNVTAHNWTLAIASAGDVEVQFGQLGSGNIVEGKAWKDGYLIYFPIDHQASYRVNGEALTEGGFMIVGPDNCFDLSSNGAHDWCSIFVPKDMLKVPGTVGQGTKIVHKEPELGSCFISLVTDVIAASKTQQCFANSAAGKRAQNDLINLSKKIVCGEHMEIPSVGTSFLSRNAISRTMEKQLKQKDYASIRVHEIAKSLNVSERTLRNAFRSYFLTSPKKYIEAVCLWEVRRDLILADPKETTVASVLADRGIYQFGRFSGRYREHFGELPSDTLHKPASLLAI